MRALSVIVILAAYFGVTGSAGAQAYWPISYSGTSTHTNGEGRLVTERMTEQTLIQLCAQKSGIADTSGLTLALHFQPGAIGDTIEVVNASDPNLFHCEVLKLAFRESFTNAAGTVVQTFAYVYNNESMIFNDPSAHSRGSAVLTQQSDSAVGSRRRHSKAPLSGTLQFWLGEWIDDRPADNVAVCSGTFTSSGPLAPP